MKKTTLLLIFLSLCSQSWSQKPAKLTASEIYHEIQKLNFLGSVLYVAAHPDDENTRLISYMANHQKARTAYLSLTRGDGGQNLVGPELRELLGVIRTQELIEARKIDGGEQLFTRANDFGFSKLPTETLKIWDKEQVMEDMIYLVRKFRPDIIINRFDHRSPGTTHGHHTSSAMLSLEVFEQTADPKIYSEQLRFVSLWKPKRLFFNTSWWFYGGRDQFNKADKSQLVNFETGVYYPLFGKSNQEIASLSRSQHQSQGFGSTGSRGEDIEYLELIKGEMPSDKKNLFEGIDTSWKRIKGGVAIGKILEVVEKEYDFINPSASLPKLMKAYQLIQKLEDTHWREVKTNEIKKIIYACAGLFLEGVADRQHYTPGSVVPLRIEAINRSPVAMQLKNIMVLPCNEKHPQQKQLQNNTSENIEINYKLPSSLHYTHPYWLEKEGTLGMYRVDEQHLIGLPDIQRQVTLAFELEILGTPITFEKEVIYKYNDPVKGEVYRPLDIVPEVSVRFREKVVIFRKNEPQKVKVIVKAGMDATKGNLSIKVPDGWNVSPTSQPFSIDRMGMETEVSFTITPTGTAQETQVGLKAVVNNTTFEREQTLIEYDHIARQQVLLPATAKWIPLEIKTFGENIACIMG
ncbi:MAG: PIG-L family deacetylase, partial [Flavobacterium sp.]